MRFFCKTKSISDKHMQPARYQIVVHPQSKLSALYDDDEWQLFAEATGEVRVTYTKHHAKRPDVDPETQQ